MLPEQQQRIMGYFIEEAKDHLNTIEQGLLNLQATIEDSEMANEVFRAAHSVKGGAAMLGIESIQRTSHRLEDYFKILKEAPVQTDRALESMFLRVFDTLQELLDQLQGPFGLTEDKAQEIMANVEPVFDQLNAHLNQLVQQQGAAAGDTAVAVEPLIARTATVSRADSFGQTAQVEESALQLVFKSDVPAYLRDILTCFKQQDDTTTRHTLQSLCQNLSHIGEQFDLTGWCDLVNTARLAVFNPDNTYRTLAPIVIREIKKGQEMVLAGRAAEIAVPEAMQSLVPKMPTDQADADLTLDDLLEGAQAPPKAEPELFDLFDAEDGDIQSDVTTDEVTEWFDTTADETAFASLDLDFMEAPSEEPLDLPTNLDQESVESFDSPLPHQGGPEVGTAELNSLADLFEGEVAGLENTWQEEEIVEDASLSGETMDIDISSDFSDLFLDDPKAAPATPNFDSGNELADLFGESLLDDSTSPSEEATAQAADSLDFSSLQGSFAGNPELSGEKRGGSEGLDDLLSGLAINEPPQIEDTSEPSDQMDWPSSESPSGLAGLDGLFGEGADSLDFPDLGEVAESNAADEPYLDTIAENTALHADMLSDLLGDEAAPNGMNLSEEGLPHSIDLSLQDHDLPNFGDPLAGEGDSPSTSAFSVDNSEFASDLAPLDDGRLAEPLGGPLDQPLISLDRLDSDVVDGADADASDDPVKTDSWDELNLKALEKDDLGSLFAEFTEDPAAAAESSERVDLTDEIDNQPLKLDPTLDIAGNFFSTPDTLQTPEQQAVKSSAEGEDAIDLTDAFFEEEVTPTPQPEAIESADDFFNVEPLTEAVGVGEADDASPATFASSGVDIDEQPPEVELIGESIAEPMVTEIEDSASEAKEPDTAASLSDQDVNCPSVQTEAGADPALADADLAESISPSNTLSEMSDVAADFSDLEDLLETDFPDLTDQLGGPETVVVDEESTAIFGADSSPVELEADRAEVEPQLSSMADNLPPVNDSVEEGQGDEFDEFDDLERLLEEADQTLGGSSPSPGLRRTGGPANRRPLRRVMGALADQTMRVSVKHLDNLSNLVGELVVNRNTLEQDQDRLRQFLDNLLFQVQQLNDVGQRMRDLYERSLLESSLISSRQVYQLGGRGDRGESHPSHSTGATFDALEMDRFTGFHTLSQEMIELIVRVRESSSDIAYTVESADQVTRQFRQVTIQLQEGLNKARMVPFAQTADRLPRAVRDISLKCGKEAKLVVEGRDTLIDKMILEQLYDPMTHLVNNAITHGVETPEERLAAGKSREGEITVRAFYQGNQTVIYVADDGAGIDADFVKEKAIQKGVISPAEAHQMPIMDVYELLFHPGFSTRDQADDFAGRGVGMDVVRTSLSEIRGSVTIDSELGKGTSFTIRLPLTLSISKALSCISNQARIAFPMDGVEDMFDVPKERIQTNPQGQSCILWRDTLLPFHPLSDLLKFNRTLGRGRVYGGNQDDEMISIVVLRSANTHIALQVDQVIGEQEIVIKQLEGPVPKPIGIAGATVLGDGRVMPIADVLELIDLSMGRVRREPSASLWTQPEETMVAEPVTLKSEPTVLIVDDSITVRELLSMSFAKVGYRVEQARDGQEAWEKLRSGLPCDLVFCDIEMPRMDGLELLSRIQKDTNLNNIPIAMLTSRGADRHRQMAVDLGASGYFTKPYLEEALLDAAQRMLNGESLVERGENEEQDRN
ncbi:MAG: response regulator [Leptolyngbyaceae cyanobacterium MO_188.B28]|nr:response regulator [Leptolyngbyaceae cyanobacterium MO_188.B28]